MWFLQEYLEVFLVFDTHCTKLATILRPNFLEEKTQKRGYNIKKDLVKHVIILNILNNCKKVLTKMNFQR